MNRAYSLVTIKRVDDDARVITGVATTPEVDRMGDVVEPEGAVFQLPIPLLMHHDSRQPIGHVTHAKVTKTGIEITAQLAKIDEPGTLKSRLDEAWQNIKLGLVKGLSIGFKPIESERIGDSFALRFTKWQWLELSCCVIAANSEATITSVKAAATGEHAHASRGAPRRNLPRYTTAGATDRRWSTSRHEAGHCVAGIVMGRGVKRAEADIGGGGRVKYFDGKPKVAAISSMAGSLAECGTLDRMSEGDGDNVMNALRQCNGDLAQLVKECEQAARHIVKHHGAAIDEVARLLRDTGVVYGWQAAGIVAKHRKVYSPSAIVKPRAKGAVYLADRPTPKIFPVRITPRESAR